MDHAGRPGLALHLDHLGDLPQRLGRPAALQVSAISPIVEAGVIG